MLTLHISQADIETANYERISHPLSIIRKDFSYLVAGAGIFREQAQDASLSSVKNYIKTYHSKGVEGLSVLKYKGPVSAEGHRELKTGRATSPTTATRQPGEEPTGIASAPPGENSATASACCSQDGTCPTADSDKQREFLADTLEPLIAQALKGECHLFFMDASHFVLGAFLGMLWCFGRIFIPSGAGRNRINVLGAVNIAGLQVETVINTTYVNADTIMEMLGLLAKKYLTFPIYIVLDNARYQHCMVVMEAAARLGIQLVFLPPYSPNLNLIERLWKFVKKKVLYAQYYNTVEKFHNAIRNGMDRVNTDSKWKPELKTLLTPKFQLFEAPVMC